MSEISGQEAETAPHTPRQEEAGVAAEAPTGQDQSSAGAAVADAAADEEKSQTKSAAPGTEEAAKELGQGQTPKVEEMTPVPVRQEAAVEPGAEADTLVVEPRQPVTEDSADPPSPVVAPENEQAENEHDRYRHTPPSAQISRRLGLNNDRTAKRAGEGEETPPKKQKTAGQALNSAVVPLGGIVDSSDVVDTVAHFQRRLLGTEVYEPGRLLFSAYNYHFNSLVQVRVARRYLTRNHGGLLRRKVWGTDVYTDDSDLVAALYHGCHIGCEGSVPEPTTDLLVTVLILPTLHKYTGSYANEVNSRSWDVPHDGFSFQVHSVRPIAQGSAESPVWERNERIRTWNQVYKQAPAPAQSV